MRLRAHSGRTVNFAHAGQQGLQAVLPCVARQHTRTRSSGYGMACRRAGKKIANQLRRFVRFMIARHFVRLEQTFHLLPPVGQHKGSCGGDIENPLVDRTLHLLAGCIEIDLGVAVKGGKIRIIVQCRKIARLHGLEAKFPFPAIVPHNERMQGGERSRCGTAGWPAR